MKTVVGSKLVVLLLLAVYAEGFKPRTVRFSTKIEAKSEQCYGESVERNIKEVQVDFEDVGGGGIGFRVIAEGRELFSKKAEFSYWLHQNPTFDSYEFCLKNDGNSAKKVFIKIWHMTPIDLDDEKRMSKVSNSDLDKLRDLAVPIYEFNRRIDAIREKLNAVRAVQMYFQESESNDVELMLKNQGDVLFWGAFVVVNMLLLSFGRLFLIRTLFDEKSKVGTLLRKGKID